MLNDRHTTLKEISSGLRAYADLLDKMVREEKIEAVTGKHELAVPAISQGRYSSDWTWEKKVRFVLEKRKQVSVQEIAQDLTKRENGDYNEMYRRTQQVLFRMQSKQEVVKIGDYGSKYSLPKK